MSSSSTNLKLSIFVQRFRKAQNLLTGVLVITEKNNQPNLKLTKTVVCEIVLECKDGLNILKTW